MDSLRRESVPSPKDSIETRWIDMVVTPLVLGRSMNGMGPSI